MVKKTKIHEPPGGLNPNVLKAFRQANEMPDEHQPDNDNQEYYDWDTCDRCRDATKHFFKKLGPATMHDIVFSDGRIKSIRVTTWSRRCLQCRPVHAPAKDMTQDPEAHDDPDDQAE
jgi:hypothetical protein